MLLLIADCQLPIYVLLTEIRKFTKQSNTNRKSAIGNRQCYYQRITTLPQVKPPPNEAIRTMSSFFTRPLSTHSSNPIGMDADEVFPCCAMFENTFASSTLRALATESVIL